MKYKNHKEDLLEELEVTSLDEIGELENTDSLDQSYDDYVSYEADLTQLIKERK